MTDINMQYFKSIIDQDVNEIVICDLDTNIIYMNPAAIRHHEKRGGKALIGTSMMRFLGTECQNKVCKGLAWFKESKDHNIIYTIHNDKYDRDEYMVALRDEEGNLIGYYEKHIVKSPETMKHYDFHE